MSKNPRNLGYTNNSDIKEILDKVENHIETNETRYQTIENLSKEIDSVQDSINDQANLAIQKMDTISQKIKSYVNDLKNNSKLDFDLSEYTDYLESLDITEIQRDKYTKLENFIKQRKPVEENVYKQDILPTTSIENKTLSKNSVISLEFHTKAKSDDFKNFPYGIGNWKEKMLENRDKVVKIPINNNLKAFEFGIKYTQNFSNVTNKSLVLERYFAGKITLTGLLSNDDGQNRIPFNLKAVIYNADYDKTGLLGPILNFKVYCDKSHIYLWLDSVEPYRMLPVLDKTNEKDNNVVMNMLDITEANLGQFYISKNFENFYVSENEKLDLTKKIGINYSVSLSLYDTTTFNDTKTSNTIKIIDYNEDFITNVVENNHILKKSDLEIKPSPIGYTQLIGYGISQTLTETNIVPENTVIELRNFDMKEYDGSRIHKLPPKSKQIWDLCDADKKIQTRVRPEAFRRCGVVATDPELDYYYMWLEEDLLFGLSRYDNQSSSNMMPLIDNAIYGDAVVNASTSTPETNILCFGKYKGKRCFISYSTDGSHNNNIYLNILNTNRYNDRSTTEKNILNSIRLSLPKNVTDPENQRYQLQAMKLGFSLFYDEYTGYWYYLGDIGPNTANQLEWQRTKDFENFESLSNIRTELDKLSTSELITDRTFDGPRMATDGNGRFVVVKFNSVNQFSLLVYDNGDFSSPVVAKTSIHANNYSQTFNAGIDSPYHFMLSTDKKGNWFMTMYDSSTSYTSGYPYWFSNDNGENWVRMDSLGIPNSWYVLPHPSEDMGIFMGYHSGYKFSLFTPRTISAPKSVSSGFFSNTEYMMNRYQRYPVDNERNNKCFKAFHHTTYGHMYEIESSMKYGISSLNFGTTMLNASEPPSTVYMQFNGRYNNSHLAGDRYSNYIYDEINDHYFMGLGTQGFVSWDYTHSTAHWFCVNRLYKVSKYDYSVQLIKNWHYDHTTNVVPTSNYDYTHDSKMYKLYGSGSAKRSISYDTDGKYNYIYGRLQFTDLAYHPQNKTLYSEKHQNFKVTDGSITPSNTSNVYTSYYRKHYVKKINKYIYCPSNYSVAIADTPDAANNNYGTNECIITLKNKHGRNINRSTKYGSPHAYKGNHYEILHDVFYNEEQNKLYVFGERGIHIFDNPDFSRRTSNTDDNTYDDNNYSFVDYPMFKEILDLKAAEQTVPNSRWIEDTAVHFHRWLRIIHDEEQNKLIFPIGDAYYFYHYWIEGERLRLNIQEEYDRKYWKGFMVFDMTDHSCIFVTEAFRQPGDGHDIDWLDPMDFAQTDINTIWGRDADGTYIVSPRTGNIYSVLDGWTRFEKRECDYKLTQVIFNEKRNAYVTFNNNTPHEYAKNPYTRPQIREIPLTTIDYKIKPERNEEIKRKIKEELDKIHKGTGKDVLFKLDIAIKCGDSHEDRYLLFQEDGSYNGENNMITRYFVPDIAFGSYFYDATEPNNAYFNDFDLYKGYYTKGLSKIYKKVPGMKDIKWSESISQPLEGLDKLMKMPTKVKLTIYPTAGEAYTVNYAVNRNNTYSDKIYFSEVLENK